MNFQMFRKGRGTRDQIANIHWIMEKAREFQKNICFCFIDYAKAFDCVSSVQSLSHVWLFATPKTVAFGIVNKAETDVFLELSCFIHDPADVGNVISGSSSFSKTKLNIWNFSSCIVELENFEHYFAIMWDECSFR